MGLGLHPYFRRAPDTTVRFAANEMLGIDAEALPDGTRHLSDVLAPFAQGARLPPAPIDNCFSGWAGEATLADTEGTITLRGFGTPHCHLYAPVRENFLCLEPVTHEPGALTRRPTAMPVVESGCAAGIAIRIAWAPS